MGHNCKWMELVLLILVIVFALFVSGTWTSWVIAIIALVLIIHRFACHCCEGGKCAAEPVVKAKPKAKRKKK